jgi:hypothetical protein
MTNIYQFFWQGVSNKKDIIIIFENKKKLTKKRNQKTKKLAFLLTPKVSENRNQKFKTIMDFFFFCKIK